MGHIDVLAHDRFLSICWLVPRRSTPQSPFTDAPKSNLRTSLQTPVEQKLLTWIPSAAFLSVYLLCFALTQKSPRQCQGGCRPWGCNTLPECFKCVAEGSIGTDGCWRWRLLNWWPLSFQISDLLDIGNEVTSIWSDVWCELGLQALETSSTDFWADDSVA